MTNNENMNIELTRREVIDVKIAIRNIIFDALHELNYENPCEDRKRVLEGTIEKWSKLREKIQEQFKAQDAE